MSKASKKTYSYGPKKVVSKCIPGTNVFWQCHQVEYPIHPTQMEIGMRVGFCEHAMRSFARKDVPAISRFVAGQISKLDRVTDQMTIKFDSWEGGLSITCSIEHYARYCIRERGTQEIVRFKVRQKRPIKKQRRAK